MDEFKQPATIANGGIVFLSASDKDEKEDEKHPGYIYYYYLNNCTLSGPLGGKIHLVHYETKSSVVSSRYQSDGGDVYVCLGSRYDRADDAVMSGVFDVLHISSGAVANNAVITNKACDVVFYVYSGGTANSTTISIDSTFGYATIYGGGFANDTILNNGRLNIYGYANGVTVNSGGSLLVRNGGTATRVRENGGYVEGNATFAPNSFSGVVLANHLLSGVTFATVHSGTTGISTTIGGRCGLGVYSGGLALDTVISSGGSLFVYSDGEASVATLVANAALFVSGGVVNSAKVYGGELYVNSDSIANNATINGGNLRVYGGGLANKTTVNANGLHVYSDGEARETTVNSGGTLYVYSDGLANNATVNLGGRLVVSDGGNATDVMENGGFVTRAANYVPNTFSGLEISSTSASVHSGTTASAPTIFNRGYLYIFDGGVASDATVNASGYLYNNGIVNTATVNGGELHLSSGGIANSATVNGGNLRVSNGGMASVTTINGGGLNVSSGGVASCATIQGGGLHVSLGGIASETTVKAGVLIASNGGLASVTTINGGRLNVSSGGSADDVMVNAGGFLTISSGGTATHVKENGGFVNGAADYDPHSFSGVEISRTSASVHSGTTAIDTTLINNGYFYVYNGGIANSTVVNSKGYLYLYNGGAANSTVVNSGGTVFLSSGGTAIGTIINAGATFSQVRGGVNSNTLLNGGSMHANDGSVVNNLTINGGAIELRFDGILTLCSASLTASIRNWGFTVNFLVNSATPGDDILFGNYSKYSNNGSLSKYAITVSGGEQTGDYILLCGAGGFSYNVTVTNEDMDVLGTFVWNKGTDTFNTLNIYGCEYALKKKSNNLVLTVNPSEGVEVYDDDLLTSAARTMSGVLLDADGDNRMLVKSGGTATGTIADADTRIFVYSGGLAYETAVNPGAILFLDSGATMSNCTVYGSAVMSAGARMEGVTTIGPGGCVDFGTNGTALVDGTVNLLLDAPAMESTNPFLFNFDSGFGVNNTSTMKYLNVTATENTSLGIYLLAQDVASDYTSSVSLMVKSGETVEESSFVWDDSIGNYAPVSVGAKTYTLTRNTMRGQANSTLSVSVAVDPISDAAYEYIARKLAYSDRPASENGYYSIEVNEANGTIKKYYFRVAKIWEGGYLNKGFDAILLERVDENQKSLHQAVLGCGGTEGYIWDIISDILVSGIGYNQFEDNKKSVYNACRKLINSTKGGCSLSITGHSLGGTLAQWFAAFSSREGGIQVDQVVTFNSPGLPTSYKGKEIAALGNAAQIRRIRHYVNDGDPVSMAGDYYLSNMGDSFYQLFDNSKRWSDAKDYSLAQHSNTLFFLESLDTKPDKRDNFLMVASEGDPSSLSSNSFSYLTVHSDANDILDIPFFLTDTLTPVQDPKGGFWLFNNQYAMLILTLAGNNVFLANDTVTRNGTESLRKTFDIIDLLDLKPANSINLYQTLTFYKSYLRITASELIKTKKQITKAIKEILDNELNAKSLFVGYDDAVISKDSEQLYNNAVLRSLSFSPKSNPYAFFDFTNQRFIKVDNPVRITVVQDDPELNINTYIVQITLSNSYDKLLWGNNKTQVCFKAPECLSNPRYSLEGIVCKDNNQTLSASNLFYADGAYWYCIDNMLLKEYKFTFTVDSSVTRERAVVEGSQQSISKDTEEIELFISDIDAVGDAPATKSRASGTKTISALVKTASNPDGITVQLQETELTGLFSGTLSVSVLNLTDEDDHLTIVYEDADNGEGVAETIEKVIDIDNIEWPDFSNLVILDIPDFFFPGDFNGDGRFMLVSGSNGVVSVYADGAAWGGLTLDDGWYVAGVGDFNGDGADDFLRVNTEGYVVGEMSNGEGAFTPQVLNFLNEGWDILGVGDFNGNGTDDVLIANPTAASETVGLLGYWESGSTWTLINGYSAEWECVATGDFNGDGKCDMLWRNWFEGEDESIYNAYCTWIVDDPVDWRMVSVANPDEWDFLCSGDFDGDKMNDIAMINNKGVVGIWGVDDGYLSSWSILSAVDTSEWTLAGVGDFDGDGTDDIAWCNTNTGLVGCWRIENKELADWQTIAAIG